MTGGALNLLDGLTLDVSGILARSGTMSFRITDISGGTLEGLSSAEDFSLAEAAMAGMCWITTLPRES